MPAKPNNTLNAKTAAYIEAVNSTPQRADVFLASQIPSVTRSQWKKRLDAGFILRDGDSLNAKDEVKLGQTLELLQLPPSEPSGYSELQIIVENESVIVINKPDGVLSHAKSALLNEATVETFLEQRQVANSVPRHGIVHRLDRATSGVMVAAKTSEVAKFLQKQFAERTVQKWYVAVVAGQLKHDKVRLDWAISRNPKQPQTFRVDVTGKSAQTEVFLLDQQQDHSTVLLRPRTGRTHQLRVHLAHLGNPIIGDSIYNQTNDKEQRLMLHAYQISIRPSSASRQETYVAPLPEHVLWNQHANTIDKSIERLTT